MKQARKGETYKVHEGKGENIKVLPRVVEAFRPDRISTD